MTTPDVDLGPGTISHENPTVTAGFTQLPNAILFNPHLTANAVRTYALLMHYMWRFDGTWPGQQKLADDLSISTRTVSRWFRELVDHKLLSIRHQGLTRPDHLTLHDPAPEIAPPEPTHASPPTPTDVSAPGAPPASAHSYRNNFSNTDAFGVVRQPPENAGQISPENADVDLILTEIPEASGEHHALLQLVRRYPTVDWAVEAALCKNHFTDPPPKKWAGVLTRWVRDGKSIAHKDDNDTPDFNVTAELQHLDRALEVLRLGDEDRLDLEAQIRAGRTAQTALQARLPELRTSHTPDQIREAWILAS